MVVVRAFYQFLPLAEEQLDQLRNRYLELGAKLGVRGLLLLAPEGVNATIAAAPDPLETFWAAVVADFPSCNIKDNPADDIPFRRWKVERRDQLIKYRDGGYVPSGKDRHLSPEQWRKSLADPETVMIDVRNRYETRIGKFRGAIDPDTENFQEFSDFLRDQPLDRSRRYLIYCTGGIRCEKAILDMQELGFTDVWQLDGGILRYLQEFPDDAFEGECFVFDERVAVGQQLEPSTRFRLCHFCGQAGEERRDCPVCHRQLALCSQCLSEEPRCRGCR